MKIFQLKSGKIIELGETKEKGKPFDYEKTIQHLIENNLGEIFKGLEFVKTEHQIEDLRPDTIAFDIDRKSFVIIEYKNVRNRGVLDQGMSYYNLLQEKKEAFVLLYHEIKKELLDMKKINWDDTRVIFISPEFTTHQIRASSSTALPIELYEIKKYEDGIITFNRIESRTYGATPEMKSKTAARARVTLPEYVEEDYLAGKYGPLNVTPQIKKLWFSLKSRILHSFEKLEFKQMKKYAGFYSKEDGSLICTLEATKSKIKLIYSIGKGEGVLSPSAFVRDVSEVGHWGSGHFQSLIQNDEDVEKSIPLIRQVYESKVRSS